MTSSLNGSKTVVTDQKGKKENEILLLYQKGESIMKKLS